MLYLTSQQKTVLSEMADGAYIGSSGHLCKNGAISMFVHGIVRRPLAAKGLIIRTTTDGEYRITNAGRQAIRDAR